MRIPTCLAVAALVVSGGCASSPCLVACPAPEPPRTVVLPARTDAAPTALAPAVPAPSPAAGAGEVARLDAEAQGLFARKRELEDVRSLNIRLSTALHLVRTSPDARNRAAAEQALEDYREHPGVRTHASAAPDVDLARPDSLGAAIRSLNADERELSARIAALQEQRKANIHLATQLHTLERDSSSRAQAAVATAREEYARAKSSVD